MTTKKVFSASDAHPTVLHAKRDPDSEIAFPVLVDINGALIISSTTGGTTTITGSVSVINVVTVTGNTTILGSVDTELPTATALADTFSNPTTPVIGAFVSGWSGTSWDRARTSGDNADTLATSGTGHFQVISHLTGYNGSSWDRLRSDITNGLDVDVTRVTGTVTITGSTSIIGTVTITGSTSVINTVTITGNTSVINTVSTLVINTVTITGSTSVINTVAITGSTSVINTVTITGSTSVINTVTITGNTTSIFERVSTATLTNVTASTASTQLLASTVGRKAAYFFNDSTASFYLKYGTTASTTSFTVLMRPQDYYEIPLPVYTGVVHGIWDATNGSLRITELS